MTSVTRHGWNMVRLAFAEKDTKKVCMRPMKSFAAVLAIFVLGLQIQAQSIPDSKKVAAPKLQALTKSFLKSAKLAKLACDQYADSVERSDSQTAVRSYKEAAEKAVVAADADSENQADKASYVCLISYQGRILDVELGYDTDIVSALKGQPTISDHAKLNRRMLEARSELESVLKAGTCKLRAATEGGCICETDGNAEAKSTPRIQTEHKR